MMMGIIISKMSKVLFREPIHMCISQRGKLRKVEHRRVVSRGKEECLVLTPSHVVLETQRRQRHHWYFQDGQASLLAETKGNGAFRAIHTAHPEDSIRGFPLRSVTPIRPFRRGIRSNPKNPKQVFQLSFFHEDNHPTLQNPRKIPSSSNPNPKNLSQILMQRSPPPQQDNQEQHQQFYKYKSPGQTIHSSKKDGRKVAGSKIEPFKKYNIREVTRAMSTQRNRLYPQILDE